MQLEELTKEQLEQKVLNGEYIKEELFITDDPKVSCDLIKPLNKFDYFGIKYSVDTTNVSIKSSAWVQVMKLENANISNSSMKITYNGVQKDIIIGADEGDFSKATTISNAVNLIEELLASKIFEAFGGDKIDFYLSTISGGRMFKVNLFLKTPEEGEIIVNSGDYNNDLLAYLKLKNGQKCVQKQNIVNEQIFTKNYSRNFPIYTELCDAIGTQYNYDNREILETTVKQDRAGGALISIEHVYGYRPIRKKIYVYNNVISE